MIVWTVAAAFAAMGLLALWRPAAITGYFGLTALNADLRNEVRAVYGGFGVALAAVLFVANVDEALRGGILVTVAVALAGMAGGRVIAWMLERSGRWPVVFGVVEIAAAAALWRVAGLS